MTRDIKLHGKTYTVKLTPEYPSEHHDPVIETLNWHITNLNIKQGTIIDIGANQGFTALAFRDNISNTGIVCIEPAEENLEHLRYNLPDATIHAMAVSNIDSMGSLGYQYSNQNYKIKKDTPGDLVVTKLDSLNIDNVMLIKIDVEGHELEVLQGAISTLEKFKPVILLEHHWDLVDKDELYNQIEKLNYKIIYLDGATDYIPGKINNYILLPNKQTNN